MACNNVIVANANECFVFTVNCIVVRGMMLIGVEGGLAFGSNPIQHDPFSGGGPSEQFTRVWTTSARLGLSF